MLRAGVSRERSREVLREDFRQIVRDESDRLRRATDEASCLQQSSVALLPTSDADLPLNSSHCRMQAKRDVDRLQKLLQDRSKLEFGSALVRTTA